MDRSLYHTNILTPETCFVIAKLARVKGRTKRHNDWLQEGHPEAEPSENATWPDAKLDTPSETQLDASTASGNATAVRTAEFWTA